jgi:PPM family protein phosphatase
MIYVASVAGKHHSVSEDTVVVGKEVLSESMEELQMPNTGFVCVCDGVGGNRGGAEASTFVCHKLANAEGIQPDAIRTFLVEINDQLISRAQETPELKQMATTLTGIYRNGDSNMLIHVGNTRAFTKQGKYLKQLTSDHTTYNWLKSSGQIEAAAVCNKSEITNCFGGNNPSLLSKLVVCELQRFSLMLLTSDGIHEYVDVDSLEAILNGEGFYSDKCNQILLAAESAGSEDDMTVVIICME